MKPNLAFQITNDLIFAGVIIEDAKVVEIQELIQARLALDVRFRDRAIVHLARGADFRRPGEPCCAQIGNTVCTNNTTEITCLKCLSGYGNSIQKTGIPVVEVEDDGE